MGLRKSGAGSRTDGFVLLDVVIAFAIIGLVLSLVWLRKAPHTGRQELAAWGYEVEALFREARSTAERSGVDAVVTVQPATHRVLANRRVLELPVDVEPAIRSTSCPSAAIVFHADGTSCSVDMKLAAPSFRVGLIVEGVTGDIRLVLP